MNRYMKRASNNLFQPTPVKKPARRRRMSNAAVIRWLIFFMPVGLVMMWSRSCRWRRIDKITVSLTSVAVLAMLACGAVTLTDGAQPVNGGVQLVSNKAAVEAYGPVIPEGATYSYKDENIIKPAVVITPEPTIVPETAYVNDGGKHFHSENCRFVDENTPCYYVPYLLRQGFDPCEDCAAAQLAVEYTGEN